MFYNGCRISLKIGLTLPTMIYMLDGQPLTTALFCVLRLGFYIVLLLSSGNNE